MTTNNNQDQNEQPSSTSTINPENILWENRVFKGIFRKKQEIVFTGQLGVLTVNWV